MAWSAGADADILALLRDLEARHDTAVTVLQARFHYELNEHCRRFRDEQRAILERFGVPSAASAGTAAALAFIADAARRAIEGVLGDGEASHLIQGSARDLAAAYDSIGLAMRQGVESGLSSAPYKQALLLVRDLLVLKVCLGAGPWSNEQLEHTFSGVFGRALEDTLASQFILAFNTIVRCGRDRSTFDKTVVKSYGESLDPETAENLFEAFRACACTSPLYTSKTKADSKGKRRPKPQPRQPGSSSEGGTSPTDVPNHTADEVSAEEGAESPAAADPSEPLKVQLPPARRQYQPLPGCAGVIVRDTFLDLLEVQSSCPSAGKSVAMTCPQLRAKEDDADAGEDLSDIGEDGEECDGMPPQWTNVPPCDECGAWDINGHWRKAKYWCEACLRKYNNLMLEAEYAPEQDYGNVDVGGPAMRYDTMDRISPTPKKFSTQVCVKNQCCLLAAQECGEGACMLVNGRERGPCSKHDHGQGGAVIRASTLQQAVSRTESIDKSFDKALPVPRWGGIYVPGVRVMKDGRESPIEPFHVSMVYAAAPRGSEGTPEVFREKILNVLRICHLKGHTELILGAWGCGWRKGSSRDVAEAFREALFGGSSDVAGAFRTVTFAIFADNEDAKATVDTFAEVFAVHLAVGGGGGCAGAGERAAALQ